MRNDSNHHFNHATTDLESGLIAKAFKAHGVKVPIERYGLEYAHKRKRASRLDPENMCTKWITDALVGCGLLRDDSYRNIPEGVQVRRPDPVDCFEDEAITITLEVLSGRSGRCY